MLKVLLYTTFLLTIFWIPGKAQFLGGNGDGYALQLQENSANIYAGGLEDGSHSASFTSSVNVFKGGSSDGHDLVTSHNPKSIFQGGNSDGYATSAKMIGFVWTGNVDTDWHKLGNWLENVVPNINSSVVIPSGVDNFPRLNSGIMSVGQNPNSGNYLCKEINITSNAELTFGSAAFLENYGLFNIRGTIYLENLAFGAIQNLSGGMIYIRSGGLLTTN